MTHILYKDLNIFSDLMAEEGIFFYENKMTGKNTDQHRKVAEQLSVSTISVSSCNRQKSYNGFSCLISRVIFTDSLLQQFLFSLNSFLRLHKL